MTYLFEIPGLGPRICKNFEITENSVQFLKQNAFLTCFSEVNEAICIRTDGIEIGKKIGI